MNFAMDNEQADLLLTLKIIFQCIRNRLKHINDEEKYFCLPNEVGTENVPFVKQTFILLRSLYPLLSLELDLFFQVVPVSLDVIINFFRCHTTAMLRNCVNVYQALMYACCFSLALIEACIRKSATDRLKDFYPNFVFSMFSSGMIYDMFCEIGGFRGFRNHCQSYILLTNLEFIGRCYFLHCLLTLFKFEGKFYFFALDSVENLHMLKHLVGKMKLLTEILFENEMSNDACLRQYAINTINDFNNLKAAPLIKNDFLEVLEETPARFYRYFP